MRPASPLKIELLRRGIAQVDLARSARLGESRLSRIVNGHVTPSADEIERLAKVLGGGMEAIDRLFGDGSDRGGVVQYKEGD